MKQGARKKSVLPASVPSQVNPFLTSSMITSQAIPASTSPNSLGEAAKIFYYCRGLNFFHKKSGESACLSASWQTPKGSWRLQLQTPTGRTFTTAKPEDWRPFSGADRLYPLSEGESLLLRSGERVRIDGFPLFFAPGGARQGEIWGRFPGGGIRRVPPEEIAESSLSCDLFARPRAGEVIWRSAPKNQGWIENTQVTSKGKRYSYSYYRYEVAVLGAGEYLATPAIRTTKEGAALLDRLIEEKRSPQEILALRSQWQAPPRGVRGKGWQGKQKKRR